MKWVPAKDNRPTWNVYFAQTGKLICQVKAKTAGEAKTWVRLLVLKPGYRREMLMAEVAA